MFVELWHNGFDLPQKIDLPPHLDMPEIVVRDGKAFARRPNGMQHEFHEVKVWFIQPEQEKKGKKK